ncbi:MAG: DUF5106 domain-containing protein [Rikenellaceae bacterium]|jgi:thiol-disulfide isomerase/thioredoxin|nr:DUF5106 domain-containing protein [Rikenellaceae bacterium]
MTGNYNKSVLAAALIAILFAVGCGNRAGKSAAVGSEPNHDLTIPVPPAMMTDPGEQTVYVAVHYWDAFDFADTTWATDSTTLGQLIVNYTGLLNMLPLKQGEQMISGFMGQVESKSGPALLARFTELIEEILHDPNSQVQNEELYIPVLEVIIASSRIDTLEKIRPRAQLEMAMRNRPGTMANDIEYTLASGTKGRLSAIRADYTVVMFYNPDCNTCREVESLLSQSATINHLMGMKKVALLAVYPDEDLTAWRKFLPEMPKGWIVGYDAGGRISIEGTYDLKAIPTLYLLDKDKRVILRDAPAGLVEDFLYNAY